MNPRGRIHARTSFEAAALMAHLARAAIRGALWIALFAAAVSPSHAERWPDRVLYFTHSAGYRHEVIPTSQAVLKQLGENSRPFRVTTTEDVSAFIRENLRRYAAVMFFTTGELPYGQKTKTAAKTGSYPPAGVASRGVFRYVFSSDQ